MVDPIFHERFRRLLSLIDVLPQGSVERISLPPSLLLILSSPSP